MLLEDTTAKKKINVTNLKTQCDQLNTKITNLQQITKIRWDNIDKIIKIFQIGIIFLIFLNAIILLIVCF